MPSLEEFRTLLAQDADAAFKAYALLINCASLDYVETSPGVFGFDEFKNVKVAFAYQVEDGKDAIIMSASNDPTAKDASYLPWKNAENGGVSKATLDGSGPAYFSTSQLDGCRFTIQYHDADRKTVTVQHLAGDLKAQGRKGYELRDDLETANAPPNADPVLRRRFSIGSGPGKTGGAGKILKESRPDTVYYEGGKAAVFGYRNGSGAWLFYGAEMTPRNVGQGLRNLTSNTRVTGSLKTDSQV